MRDPMEPSWEDEIPVFPSERLLIRTGALQKGIKKDREPLKRLQKGQEPQERKVLTASVFGNPLSHLDVHPTD